IGELTQVATKLGAVFEDFGGGAAGVGDDLAAAAHSFLAALLDFALDFGAQGGGFLVDAGEDAFALALGLFADCLELLLDDGLLAGEFAAHLTAHRVGFVLSGADDLVGFGLSGTDQLV